MSKDHLIPASKACPSEARRIAEALLLAKGNQAPLRPAGVQQQSAATCALAMIAQQRYTTAMIDLVKTASESPAVKSSVADDIPLDVLRPRLVAAMLPHVPFDGWSAATRDAAAHDAGIDRDIAGLALPDAVAMTDAYTARADEMMTQSMVAAGVDTMKIRARIRLALVTRLEQASQDKEAVRRALAIMAMPHNAGLGLRTLWRTADAMWRAAGDTATDFNHYSKRIILGSVYSATLLYWLEDDSEAMADTLAFIDRRIDSVMAFEKNKAQFKSAFDWVPNPARFLGRLRYPVSST